MRVPHSTPDIEAAQGFDVPPPSLPPSSAHVAEAYSQPNSLDPLSCFKSANTCVQQQHHLDPKYHGTGSGLAQLVQRKTGDKSTTNKILVAMIVLAVLAIICISGNTILNSPHNTSKFGSTVEDEHTLELFDLPQKDIDALLQSPAQRADKFNAEHGEGAAAKVVILVAGPAAKSFRHGDVDRLLRSPGSFKEQFDVLYGTGSSELMLEKRKESTDLRKLIIEARKEKLRTLRVHRLNAMRTGQRDEHTAITKRSTKQREELVSMQRRERASRHANGATKDHVNGATKDHEVSAEEDGSTSEGDNMGDSTENSQEDGDVDNADDDQENSTTLVSESFEAPLGDGNSVDGEARTDNAVDGEEPGSSEAPLGDGNSVDRQERTAMSEGVEDFPDGNPDEVTDGSTDEAADGSIDEAADGSRDEAADGSIDEAVNGSMDEAVDGSMDSAADGNTDSAELDGSIDEAADGSMDEAGNGSTTEAADGNTDRAELDGSVDEAANGNSDESADGSIDEAADGS